jgi:hypothetical protein
MGDVVVGLCAALGLALVVWLKVVRPVRGDVAWARQGKRIDAARHRRLARRAGEDAPR